MKKNIGSHLALYPTPLVVVGAVVNGKPTYTLAGHVGIIGHTHITVSLATAHYINQGIRESKSLTVSIVEESMLKKADYAGTVSGKKVDKSELFASTPAENGAPIIEEAPVVMELHVEDIYETQAFETFICTIKGVHAEESVLDEKGKINYRVLKPVLFEMPTYEYLKTGEIIGKCMQMNK